jgi:DNA-binding FadR family transcriptional regulator
LRRSICRPYEGIVTPAGDWLRQEQRPGSGNWRFCAHPSPAFLRDVAEFRVLIEPRAAAQAATRGKSGATAAIL